MSALLRSQGDEGFEACPDDLLSAFLNGLIIERRGPPPAGKPPVADAAACSNNDVLKKLRIAFKLHEKDVVSVVNAAGMTLSKGELGALFRKAEHKPFRPAGDQVVRKFLKGLAIRLRGSSDSSDSSD